MKKYSLIYYVVHLFARFETALAADEANNLFAGATNNAMMIKKGKATKSPSASTPAPTFRVKKAKSGKGTKATPGFVLTGADTGLNIISCDHSSVEVMGTRAVEIQQGNILIYVPHETATCTSCNPLYQKVQSIMTSAQDSDNMFLTTTFVTLSEIVTLGLTPNDIALGSEMIEPKFECPHSSVQGESVDNKLKTDNNSSKGKEDSGEADIVIYDKLPPPPPSPFDASVSVLTGSCNAKWEKKSTGGRCTHTNCYVGVDGNPKDCFECGQVLKPDQTGCDNKCGAGGSIFNTDGDFYTYDFGPACCNHDHCWSSSTFTKEACDSTFFDELKSACPPPSIANALVTALFPLWGTALGPLGCNIFASLFYFAVSKTSISAQAYKDAQELQAAHEQKDICIAKCPTT